MNDLETLVNYYYKTEYLMAYNPSYQPLSRTNCITQIVSGYDVLENKTSLNLTGRQYSMWFSDPDKRNLSDLSDSSKIYLELSLNMDFFSYVYAEIDTTLVNNVQYQFADGFYFVHPATTAINFTQKLMPDCPYLGNISNKIDSRCLRSYQKMKNFSIWETLTAGSELRSLALFNAPNLLIGSNGIISAEFCLAPLIPTTYKFDNVLCIDYSFAGS